jgi:hypothetical protein
MNFEKFKLAIGKIAQSFCKVALEDVQKILKVNHKKLQEMEKVDAEHKRKISDVAAASKTAEAEEVKENQK